MGGARLVSVSDIRTGAEAALCWTVSSSGDLTPTPEPYRVIAKSVLCLEVSPDGNTVYAGAVSGWLHAVNLLDSAQNRFVRTKVGDPITALAANPDGKSLLVGTGGGNVLVFSTALEQKDREWTYRGPIKSLVPNSPLGGYSVGFGDGIIFMLPPVCQGFEIATGGRLSWLTRLPDGGFAANDGAGRVLVVGRHQYSLPTGDTGTVRAGTVTRDGKTLFTAGDDGIIRSWDLSTDLRDRAATLAGVVTAVGIHPDGERVVVLTGHNSVVDHAGTDRETRIRPQNPLGQLIAVRVPKETRPDQNVVVVEVRDQAVIVCELNNNGSTELMRFTLPDEASPISAHLSADGSRLTVGDDRGRMIV